MQDASEEVDRKVVPRWRSVIDTPSSELVSSRPEPAKIIKADAELAEVRNAWKQKKDIFSAVDFFYAASFVAMDDEAIEAGRFILSNPDIQSPLTEFVRRKINENSKELIPNATVSMIEVGQKISNIKRRLAKYPRNPISHVDIARLYATVGQSEKSEKHLFIALSLAPENRFIIRSAVRYFIHEHEPERAYSVVKNLRSRDPWIMSAVITVREILGRPQQDIRLAKNTLELGLQPTQTTELSAALGTLELNSGSFKRAKKYFRESALQPNDNSVAQLHWAKGRGGIDFDRDLLKVDRSYEARANSASETENWSDAIENAKLWQSDEPFSVRPSTFGTLIASEYLGDYETARTFAQRGLLANPRDHGLWNNLAYTEAALGNFNEAEKALGHIPSSSLSNLDEATLNATKGFIAFKQGRSDEGRNLYSVAIEKAKENGQRALIERATIHWLAGELSAGFAISSEVKDTIASIFADEKKRTREGHRAFQHVLSPKLQNQKDKELLIEDDIVKKVISSIISDY